MQDFINSFTSASTWDVQTILKNNAISGDVQKFLFNVYFTLFQGFVAAAIGSYVQMQMHISGMLTHFALIGVLMYLASIPGYTNQQLQTKLPVFLGFCFLKGVAIGGIVEIALRVDPNIVFMAMMGTMIVFLCFSGAALLSKRRSFFYLSGFLSSALSLFFYISIFSWFFPSVGRDAVMNMQIYGGLVVFSGYVIVDTQVILEKAVTGINNKDYVKAALELFIDAIALFVRILIIILRNTQEKKKREERKKRRN